jgi:NAD(P)-dependent dehydrogenase (short-subunit alcohol dehydrogenase family)
MKNTDNKWQATAVGRLAGRIAVVTAAAGGIGGATAHRLARDGAVVVAVDHAPLVKEVQASIRALGGEATGLQLDCTDEAAVVRAFSDLASKYGQIDILVNAVGGGMVRPSEFWCSEAAVWRRVIDVTLVSAMLCARQVVPGMRERRYGKVVNIASSVAVQPSPAMADYSAAKAGILGFTRSIAFELASFGININAVSPGPIQTKGMDELPPEVKARAVSLVPMGVIGQPDDVANAVSFLVSDESRYITGQNLAVNGGRAYN